MNKAIKFKNFSDEDFTHKYDGVPYTIKAGETITLPGYLAEHFCHHLVNREMMKGLSDSTMTSMLDENFRKPWVEKCLISEQEVANPMEAEIASLNAVEEAEAPKVPELKPKNKGGRPKKTEII